MASMGSGSLFGAGGLGATAQPAGISSGNHPSSLFGTTPASQTAPNSSLFGGQAQAQQQPSQPSIFGQGGQAQMSTTQSVQSSGQATQPAFFNSLLERGKKRPIASIGQNSNFEELPSLQLGLDDIRRKARELGTKGPGESVQQVSSSKAHYLLAASGISPGHALRDLKALDPHASISLPSREQEVFDPDNQKFLRNIQQRGRKVMIDESLARAQRDFDTFLEQKVDLDWEDQRQRIFQHFGLTHKDDSFGETRGSFGRSMRQSKQAGPTSSFGAAGASRRSVFGRSGLEKSVIGAPGTGKANRPLFEEPVDRNEGSGSQSSDLRFLREKMGFYASKVQLLNSARIQGRPFPILHEFSEVERHAGGDVPSQLFDAYQALISIVKESASLNTVSNSETVRERQFSEDYLDETPNSRKATNLRKRIVEGSRYFLEKQFYAEVENVIAKNPREAQLGGIPTVVNKIRAYIRLRAARKDLAPDGTELQMVGNDYCWILIFYLLRCGFVTEAAEYVSQDPGFRSLDHKFVTYMTTFAQNRRLPRDLQQKINGEYQQRSRNAPENTVDPYRMACYKIIGRCDLTRRRLEGVNQSVEDWMWLQFSLAREDDRAEEVAGDVFGLEDIQIDITEIGQRVFGKGQEVSGGYGTFFLLQILGGMFEQAVSYLGSYAPVSAVHFAIALAYYGLLRVSDFYTSGEDILSFTVKQYPQISFGRLITQYTREFRTGYVEAAVDYFCLLCLNADLPGSLGKSQASVCHEALREFVLETRDFAKLLGDIRSDGTRIQGLIEQRMSLIKLVDQEEFLKTITIQAAAIADDKGLITDAVLLYHLAEDYDRVIDIINRALSDAVGVELGSPGLKLQPLRPRTNSLQHPNGSEIEVHAEPGSSLSLTAVDDPVVLAKNMIGLYNTNALYYQRIRQVNRDACGLLLRMMEAKGEVEAGKWTPALDAINELNILPLRARGSVSFIRSAAQAFSSFPPIISRNVGHVIMWSITSIGYERERLSSGAYENETRQGLADELLVMAKDLMVFSGMVKYKLPPRVYETLARAGADIGAY
ncbi:linker nucleoporin NIC96 [Aspergillus clavatus NRRL 1]|uniref:Nuclear pore protein (Nic96), putative n=1 Tax=Aspergillus clavatus (strain ATCC 1007 / CBS 513.65 / DSM 816 / NCTC 3887 / NRRL 1 / QM 1276 / 107) TaxID=344612 RepID=A1C8Z2_ASPCL|nr:nuclear pore protein (Nic96), putative [Aspergillus clavatus NRRL 1]EAW13316.1 nuclear pore protein (Nic96), putative [Aspergillus clavatus NRRL 1]